MTFGFCVQEHIQNHPFPQSPLTPLPGALCLPCTCMPGICVLESGVLLSVCLYICLSVCLWICHCVPLQAMEGYGFGSSFSWALSVMHLREA